MWVLRPSSIIRDPDGVLWTAGHPGHPRFTGWYFWRLRKAWIGWIVDKSDVWSFDRWTQDVKVIRPK